MSRRHTSRVRCSLWFYQTYQYCHFLARRVFDNKFYFCCGVVRFWRTTLHVEVRAFHGGRHGTRHAAASACFLFNPLFVDLCNRPMRSAGGRAPCRQWWGLCALVRRLQTALCWADRSPAGPPPQTGHDCVYCRPMPGRHSYRVCSANTHTRTHALLCSRHRYDSDDRTYTLVRSLSFSPLYLHTADIW